MHLCIPETRVSQKMSARINSRRYSVSLYEAVSMLEALDQFLKRPECNASDDSFFCLGLIAHPMNTNRAHWHIKVHSGKWDQ